MDTPCTCNCGPNISACDCPPAKPTHGTPDTTPDTTPDAGADDGDFWIDHTGRRIPFVWIDGRL